MNAAEILVVILSIFLAIFLIVGIILSVLLIKVTLQIRRVATKAEKAAGGLEHLASNVSNVASKALLSKIIMKAARVAYSKKKGGKHEG